MSKDIYLIRHSVTNANIAGLLCGSTQASLSEKGKQLAKTVAEEKMNTDKNFKKAVNKSKRIIVSSLERTKETAKIMFPDITCHLPYKEFDEINFGKYEMLSIDEVPDEIIKMWKCCPEKLTFPNGDNIQQRATDVYECLLSIAEGEKSPIIIVSSEAILQLLMTKIRGLPLADFYKINVPNCGMIHLRYSKHKEMFREIS